MVKFTRPKYLEKLKEIQISRKIQPIMISKMTDP